MNKFAQVRTSGRLKYSNKLHKKDLPDAMPPLLPLGQIRQLFHRRHFLGDF